MTAFARYGPAFARLLLAHIFLISCFGKLTDFSGYTGMMSSIGMPMPSFLLVCAILLTGGGGLALLLGWCTRWGALALIVFTAVATFYFHNFWAFEGMDFVNQQNHFMKNIAIIGGLLFVMFHGAGPLSVDNRRAEA